MGKVNDTVLQRFARPKSVKGDRAYFSLSQLRKLIRSNRLDANYQFLAIQLLLYLEGFVDRLPRIYISSSRGELQDANAAIPASQVKEGLSSLVDSLNEASAKGQIKPIETEPSRNHSDEKYGDILP